MAYFDRLFQSLSNMIDLWIRPIPFSNLYLLHPILKGKGVARAHNQILGILDMTTNLFSSVPQERTCPLRRNRIHASDTILIPIHAECTPIERNPGLPDNLGAP